jgi:hypothetical protein
LRETLRAKGVNRINFLKVDIEGAEYDVLLGDKALWQMTLENLFVEADRTPRDTRYSFDELLSFLKDKFSQISVTDGDYPLISCRNG